MFKNPRVGVTLIILGLLLISVSFIWRLLIPEEMVWNPEQAHENATAAADLHHKTHLAAHAEIDDLTEEEKGRIMSELEAAQARFDTSRSALDRARTVRGQTALAIRWTGVGIALLGLFQYQLVKPTR